MKMKKMRLLMLTLLVWSAASMNAQVRIGGTIDPDASSVLDLNKTDGGAPDGNLGLALPRVTLTSEDMQLVTGVNPKNGAMVYGVNASFGGAGLYYWVTNKWVKAFGGAEVDGIIGNEVSKAYGGGGLVIKGGTTAANPMSVAIDTLGVSTGKINNSAVTAAKLNQMGAVKGDVLYWTGTTWKPSRTYWREAVTVTLTSTSGSTNVNDAGEPICAGGKIVMAGIHWWQDQSTYPNAYAPSFDVTNGVVYSALPVGYLNKGPLPLTMGLSVLCGVKSAFPF
jgi:hypothetical protein